VLAIEEFAPFSSTVPFGGAAHSSTEESIAGVATALVFLPL